MFGTYLHRWILCLLAVAALMTGAAYAFERDDGMLEVYFLDVGQGDAIYVRTPSGRDMLIDAGSSKAVIARLSEVMPWYDRHIDVLLETHPDADHIGGMPDILERYGVGLFIEPGIESPNEVDDEIKRLILEKDIDSILARRGMVIDFRDGASLTIFYPDKDLSGSKDTNDASVIGRLMYASTSVMLTGDSSQKIERYLLSLDAASLDSDILKVGHHGSRTSTSKAYLDAVTPDIAVISVGKDNRYGHPKQEVIDALVEAKADVLRTDLEGTIKYISDGTSFVRK